MTDESRRRDTPADLILSISLAVLAIAALIFCVANAAYIARSLGLW